MSGEPAQVIASLLSSGTTGQVPTSIGLGVLPVMASVGAPISSRPWLRASAQAVGTQTTVILSSEGQDTIFVGPIPALGAGVFGRVAVCAWTNSNPAPTDWQVQFRLDGSGVGVGSFAFSLANSPADYTSTAGAWDSGTPALALNQRISVLAFGSALTDLFIQVSAEVVMT